MFRLHASRIKYNNDKRQLNNDNNIIKVTLDRNNSITSWRRKQNYDVNSGN